MATFTTRIELHKATEDDYEVLHTAMEKQGFSRTIEDSNGKIYKLPTAEYNYRGEITRQEVFDKAQVAAQTTKKGYWILVTESNGRTFLLEEVK